MRAPFIVRTKRRFQPNVAQKHRCSRASRRGESAIQILFRSVLRDTAAPRPVIFHSRFILSPAIDFVTSDPGPNYFYFLPAHPAAVCSFCESHAPRGSRRTFTSQAAYLFFPNKEDEIFTDDYLACVFKQTHGWENCVWLWNYIIMNTQTKRSSVILKLLFKISVYWGFVKKICPIMHSMHNRYNF